ncbi:TonB-dependent siderophore receptor [Paraburkholderia bonniea]|uniref:TonB-dependent siderophore receptor n=1 Tax=Paraburkholderia bonniea TaxID=2152891 RepID=UPI00157FCDFE|nr:TonB-dependent siderophore receptor [Paraburkholderia bonniea]WJF91899.1 TonB-dependent siderophore receptor [Paraburkholderia bonniea]WJF95218.1 TonB-dependent siderophore receptor [Paraburkholderia bonniea]
MKWVTSTQRRNFPPRAIAAAVSLTFLTLAASYANAQAAPQQNSVQTSGGSSSAGSSSGSGSSSSSEANTARRTEVSQATPGSTLPVIKVEETADDDGTVGLVAHRTRTGTKTDTPLDEVPQTVNIVTSEQIEQQGATTINQALRYVPGFSSYGASTRSDWYTALRGFTPSVFVDGLQVPNTMNLASWRVDPYQVESITVLRGPTSVLYGQGDPGSLVDIQTKQPTADAVREIELQLGTDARKQIGLDLGGKIDQNGTLTYRFIGVGRDGNMATGPHADQRLLLAPSVKWQPTADTSLTVYATYLRDNADVSDNFLPASGTILPNPNGTISERLYTGEASFARYDKRQWSVGYQFEHHFDPVWTFRQNTRYMHLSLNNATVYGGGLDTSDPTDASITRYAGLFQPNYSRFDIDNQAQAKFRTGTVEHTLLAGFEYNRQQSTDSEQLALAPSLNVFNPVYTPVTSAIFSGPNAYSPTSTQQALDSFGLYLQDQIKLTPRWVVTLGGRQDWSRSSTHDLIAGTQTQQDDHAFTGRVGAVYLGDYGLSPYISYATSFNPQLGVTQSGTPFKPSRGRQIEAGLRWQPFSKNLMLNAALYQINQTNVTTPDPTDPTGTFSVQTGEVRSRGIEFSAVGNLTRELSLIASYAYQDVKNIAANDASLNHWPVSIPLPRQSASLWGDWTWHSGVLSGLGVGLGLRYSSSSAGGQDNSLSVPGYTVYDAALHYDVRSWRFAVNATNLFNRRFVTGCQSAATCFYGNPRTVLATARYDW